MLNDLAKFKNSLNIDPSGSGKPRIEAHTADFEQSDDLFNFESLLPHAKNLLFSCRFSRKLTFNVV
jgi:hypothetical protein